MQGGDASRFKPIIEDIRERSKNGAGELFLDDLGLVTNQILAEVNSVRSIADLEKNVQEAETLDFESLQAVFETLKHATNQELPYPIPNDKKRTLKDFLAEIQATLKAMNEHQLKLGPTEILFRADLQLDSLLQYALMCLIDQEAVLAKVEQQILEKLKSIPNDTIADIWGQIKSEFDKGAFAEGLPNDPDILGESFFHQGPPIETRKKIAAFLIRYKSKLWLQAFQQGMQSFPMRSPGVARLSLLRRDGSINTLSSSDLLLFNSVLRTVVLWELATYKTPDYLLRRFGCGKAGRFLGSNEYARVKAALEKLLPSNRLRYVSFLLDELLNLVNLTSVYFIRDNPIERVLRAYKLSLELFASEVNKEISTYKTREKEIRLQKEICRVLLQKDIYSYGVLFGNSEIDLLTKSTYGEIFVIETKLFKSNPNANIIKKNLSQLLSYMAQHSQSKGILFIYNLSDRVIVTPETWIKGRIAIIAVNLGKKTPSQREKALVLIEPKAPNELIDIYSVN